MSIVSLKNLIKKKRFLWFVLYPAIISRRIILERREQKKLAIGIEVLDNLCNLLIEDPVIEISEFEGRFMIDCRSDVFKHLVIRKEYEPILVQRCIDLIDSSRDVIDVGANIGFYTVFCARLLKSGKVLSIEPSRNALSRLYRNIQMNCVQDRIIVFEGVASNYCGEAEIKTIEGKEEYSSLGKMSHPAISTSIYTSEQVASASVDVLCNRFGLDPGFIKVDVEGMEHLVFDGARAVLKSHRPVILSELSDYLLRQNGSSSREVIKLIEEYGYYVLDPTDMRMKSGHEEFGEILCLPK